MPRNAIATTTADARGFAAGLLMIALAALAALIEPLSQIFRVVPRNYNEGWNAFWADAAAHGAALYPTPDSPLANNYPPVSFHVVGFIGRIIGDNVIAGRLVSLASFVLIMAAVYLFLRATGSARRIALAGAVILCLMFGYFAQNYIAMNDPQLLAHAFMLCALVVMWRLDFSRGAVIIGALLMLLGGFTKHLLIPLPLALTVWIAIYRRGSLLPWLACFAVGLPLGLWLVSQAYPPFIAELLSARAYSLPETVRATLHASTRFLPLLLIGGIPLARAIRAEGRAAFSPALVLVLLYATLSLVIGGIAAGGEGVTRNAFFDLLIASAMFAAMGLRQLMEQGSVRRVLGLSAVPMIVAFLGAGTLMYALATVPKTVRELREIDALETDTRATIEMIQRLGEGRAACETLALCYWAHDSFTMDFFNYGRKIRTGIASVEDCEAALQRGDFPVLQLEPDKRLGTAEGKRLWPCTPAIHEYYTVAFRSRAGTLLVPKQKLAKS